MVYLQTATWSGLKSKLSRSKYFWSIQGWTTETCGLVDWWKGKFPGSSCVFEGRLALSSDPPSRLASPPSSLVSHYRKAASQPQMAFTSIISFIQQSFSSIFCCFDDSGRNTDTVGQVQILVQSVTEYTIIPNQWVWFWDNQRWDELTMLKVTHQWCGQLNLWPSGLARAYAPLPGP